MTTFKFGEVFASAAEINTGTEAAKAIAPDQLKLSAPTLAGLALSLASSADGDMWYRASGIFARLAKGDANTKLFMNAGATAPEWASGLSKVSTTHDLSTATGAKGITGAGFKPSMAIVFGVVNNAVGQGFWAIITSAGIIGVTNGANVSAGKWYTGSVIYVTGSDYVTFDNIGGAWDADGVTINFTKGGSPTGTLTLEVSFFR